MWYSRLRVQTTWSSEENHLYLKKKTQTAGARIKTATVADVPAETKTMTRIILTTLRGGQKLRTKAEK